MKAQANRLFSNRQHGVALPIALIVLAAMVLAAVSLVRSVDTATMVAGNLTFKQRATHAGDEGIRQAFLWLRNTAMNNPASLNNTDIGSGYYSTQHADDPNWNPATNWPAAGAVMLAEDAGGNRVSYVIHRLCTLPGVSYNAPNQQCATYTGSSAASSGGSQSVDAPEFIGVVYVYYRVTARIEGPRNTVSYVQSLMLVPAT
jgi:Tfp pilus assembly protein PilX